MSDPKPDGKELRSTFHAVTETKRILGPGYGFTGLNDFALRKIFLYAGSAHLNLRWIRSGGDSRVLSSHYPGGTDDLRVATSWHDTDRRRAISSGYTCGSFDLTGAGEVAQVG
jgi:hypothetical protein